MIAHKKVLGTDGKPEAAQIPWDVFITLSEPEELELSTEEKNELHEALADSKEGNRDAFIHPDQV